MKQVELDKKKIGVVSTGILGKLAYITVAIFYSSLTMKILNFY
jgi:hypothetical protein